MGNFRSARRPDDGDRPSKPARRSLEDRAEAKMDRMASNARLIRSFILAAVGEEADRDNVDEAIRRAVETFKANGEQRYAAALLALGHLARMTAPMSFVFMGRLIAERIISEETRKNGGDMPAAISPDEMMSRARGNVRFSDAVVELNQSVSQMVRMIDDAADVIRQMEKDGSLSIEEPEEDEDDE